MLDRKQVRALIDQLEYQITQMQDDDDRLCEACHLAILAKYFHPSRLDGKRHPVCDCDRDE